MWATKHHIQIKFATSGLFHLLFWPHWQEYTALSLHEAAQRYDVLPFCFIPCTAHRLNADNDRMLYAQTTMLLLHFPSSGLVLSLYSMSLIYNCRDTFLHAWRVWSLFSIYCNIKQKSETSHNIVLYKPVDHVLPWVLQEEHTQFNMHPLFPYCPCRKNVENPIPLTCYAIMETLVGIKGNDFRLEAYILKLFLCMTVNIAISCSFIAETFIKPKMLNFTQ